MNPATKALWVLLAAALIACGPNISVNTEYDPMVDFSGMRTYNWATPSGSQSTTGLRTDNPQTDARIRAVVDEQLDDHGYLIDVENPDFLIGYNALVVDRITAQTINDRYNYGAGWGYTYYGLDYTAGPARTVTTYGEGSLIIDIIRPDDRTLMWRGYAQAELDPEDSVEDRTELIRKAVKEMFSYFPPQ